MSANDLPRTLSTNVSDVRAARFEAAWLQRRDDQPPPRWQDYLPDAHEPSDAGQIFLLLQMDIECRVRAKLPALLRERYFDHPRLQQTDVRLNAERQVQLIRWEYQQRWQLGQRVRRSDYQAAFPEHAQALSDLKPRSICPHCRQAFVLEETVETLSCPVCDGSSERNTLASETGVAAAEAPQLDLRDYQLLERLGGGGMGDVYRAGDPGLGRDLAVKVMKGSWQGHSLAEQRFLREARVTGSLQHPGIVPVYNIGRLADGRLHYTMRLVRGSTFADILQETAGKAERLPELLSIFEKVCQAVAYAHSKRVIHRDLKPSNVMVGRFGEVQVMDWGLAKVLTPGERSCVSAPSEEEAFGTRIHTESGDTPLDLTRMGQGMGTPAYMPPEQALGEWDAVDERADVFALGAMLCEILTGQPPYAERDGEEALRKARRGELTAALARLEVCGADAALLELCRSCLAPQRAGRPRDVAEVAQRMAAYQSEVQERLRRAELERSSALIRAREERKRRRWMLAALVLLLTGAAGSVWQAIRATNAEKQAWTTAEAEREAKQLAQTRLGQIEKTNEVLRSVFRDLDPRAEEKGGPSLRQQLAKQLEQAAAQLDEAAIGDELATARLQGALGTSLTNLGQAELAIKLLSKAETTLQSKLGPDHLETLTCRSSLAIANKYAGHSAEAFRLFEQILKQYESQRGPDHPETLTARSNLANAYTFTGRPAEAIPLLEQTLKQSEAKLGPDHPNTLTYRNSLAEAYHHAGHIGEAIRLQEQTLKQREAKLGIDHPDTLNSRNNLANAYRSAGRTADAIRLGEQTLKQMEAKLGPEHPHTLNSRAILAEAYGAAGRTADSIRLHEQTLQQRLANFGAYHPDTLSSQNVLGVAYLRAGRIADAIRLHEQTLRQREALLGNDHFLTLSSRSNLAEAYHAAGRLDESIRLHEQTLKLREAKLGADHIKTLESMAHLGIAYRDGGRLAEGISLLETTLQRARKGSEALPALLSRVPISLAQAYEKAGQFAKAELICRAELEQAQQQYGSKDARTASAAGRLGFNLLQQKKFRDAEPLLRQDLEWREAARPGAWSTFNTRSLLGEALLGQKKYTEAEPLLLQGYQGLKQRQDKIPPLTRHDRLSEALERLVLLYEATNQKDKAAQWRKKLEEAKAAPKKSKP